MHIRSALAGAGGAVAVAAGVFFAVAASNAQPADVPAQPVAVEEAFEPAPGRYSTLDVQDPIEYVAPEPEPTVEPEPVVEPEPEPEPVAPAPVKEEPVTQPAPQPQPAPAEKKIPGTDQIAPPMPATEYEEKPTAPPSPEPRQPDPEPQPEAQP